MLFFEVSDWTEELTARHRLLLDIKRLAEALKIDFAFPTQTLHIEKSDQIPQDNAIPGRENLIEIIEDFGPNGSQARPNGLWAVKD